MKPLSFLATLFLAATTSLCTPLAQAADNYSYGDRVDVAKVVSITPASNDCGVVPVTMVYQNHQGRLRQLHYQVMNDCWPTN